MTFKERAEINEIQAQQAFIDRFGANASDIFKDCQTVGEIKRFYERVTCTKDGVCFYNAYDSIYNPEDKARFNRIIEGRLL